ncbi:MAG TPA: thiol-disulfide oxidoreductase DCC family protein [Steroidobacteraceae bacterium]|nr:thiol-disulfide oxidoreductase DCC family protein [Steroidobacteraceae bacterium]
MKTQQHTTSQGDTIIVFDGVCALCSGWVEFVLRRDSHRQFKFAAMQSVGGAQLLTQHGIDADNPMTFLVLSGGRPFTETDAVVEIVRQLGWMWRALAFVLSLVPKRIRNACYRTIATHRYRWFGRRETCYVPRIAERDRFIA